MKPRPWKTIALPDLDLPPAVAHELSWWLHGLALEFDLHYQDEIRSHIQWEDNQRDELDALFDEGLED